jgi:hypothetical protein
MAVAGLLAASVLVLGIYALNLNSDLDDADAQIVHRPGRPGAVRSSGGARASGHGIPRAVWHPGTATSGSRWIAGLLAGVGRQRLRCSGPRLDSATATRPSGCDGGGHDRGLGDRCGAGCDGLGHDRGFRHRCADDSDSSDTCCS